jgi:hypothetical protein
MDHYPSPTTTQSCFEPGSREHCLGLSYIAVPRVKTLAGVLFKVLFDFEYLLGPDSVYLKIES